MRLGRFFETMIVGGERQTLRASVLEIARILHTDVVLNGELEQGRNIVCR